MTRLSGLVHTEMHKLGSAKAPAMESRFFRGDLDRDVDVALGLRGFRPIVVLVWKVS